ncbi:FtsP/CotA-like multicopper oxidase with cupredoxin domain [Methanolinea mesophila]|uniref:multicopper oxidase family protein n=1 Tax=Methanolinea mesophila TaxID=547055 RepID=UPI001AE9AAD2|nr:multicopper oxidase [Methanolinea mesophila]MBP1929527.1 FtsP/CotA-like multicopper oxidase with cupredoxin domain [Methanolinea mesophila]
MNRSENIQWMRGGIMAVLALALLACIAMPVSALIDPATIPKWENTITGPPPVYVPVSPNYYEVNMTVFSQQVLPPSMSLTTTVWGYGGLAKDAVTGAPLGFVRNSPGPSFEAAKGTPINVRWINEINTPHMFAVDPTLHWANPNSIPMMLSPPFPPFPPGFVPGAPNNTNNYDAQSPVPVVVHLHGSEVTAASDGDPDQWFTASGVHGSTYYTNTTFPQTANSAVYDYPNTQPPATLWYHDHALGITRLNVMSGLAGFYLLRDPVDPLASSLPQGKYEVPLVFQDRTFNDDGSFYFYTVGNVPDVHPYWNPEFFGDTIMVNGLVWPKMNVDKAAYRFRLLDGSNARFYTLTLSNGMSFTQIGTDGGYLKGPAVMNQLTIAPGERADIIIDFSRLPTGTEVILMNSAATPFPSGDPVDANTAQLIKFVVGPTTGPRPARLPTSLNPTLTGNFPNLPAPTNTRILTLQEVVDPGDNPIEILLDGQKWAAPISENPQVGTTEEWVIVNPTMDTHPIHLHLVQFQLVSRQNFNVDAYEAQWLAVNGQPPLSNATIPVDPTPYLTGTATPPRVSEIGWKDTIQMNPGQVTKIRVRWAQQTGTPYPFDVTTGEYVWHCHILDHEDNEMMRPYIVTP